MPQLFLLAVAQAVRSAKDLKVVIKSNFTTECFLFQIMFYNFLEMFTVVFFGFPNQALINTNNQLFGLTNVELLFV